MISGRHICKWKVCRGRKKFLSWEKFSPAQIYQPLVSSLGRCLNPLIGYRLVCLTFSATPIFEMSETGYISALYFLQLWTFPNFSINEVSFSVLLNIGLISLLVLQNKLDIAVVPIQLSRFYIAPSLAPISCLIHQNAVWKPNPT